MEKTLKEFNALVEEVIDFGKMYIEVLDTENRATMDAIVKFCITVKVGIMTGNVPDEDILIVGNTALRAGLDAMRASVAVEV